MSKNEDDHLMQEILALADRAELNKPGFADIGALSATLQQHFEHRTINEIEEKMKDVWRARNLFWT